MYIDQNLQGKTKINREEKVVFVYSLSSIPVISISLKLATLLGIPQLDFKLKLSQVKINRI